MKKSHIILICMNSILLILAVILALHYFSVCKNHDVYKYDSSVLKPVSEIQIK